MIYETGQVELSKEIAACISRALEEDVGSGDATTESVVPSDLRATAKVIAKQDGIVSGLDVARSAFRELDHTVQFRPSVLEGARIGRGQLLAEVTGSARSILTAERTALNFLGRMSGIASLTREFVDAIAGTSAIILDTRKTAPGLRAIDKLAVRHGGGQNHRHGLYDMVLIKENHIACAGSLAEAIRRARKAHPTLDIEVEVRNLEELREALGTGIRRILLDNLTINEINEAVRINAGHAQLEVSGNVNLQNVRAIAETGVDYISVGALTHSAPAFDVSLLWLG